MKSVPELFLHDAPETTARFRLNDRTIQAQRTLDFMETGARCYSLKSKSLKYLI